MDFVEFVGYHERDSRDRSIVLPLVQASRLDYRIYKMLRAKWDT
ncbi:hypothetical protein PEPS_07720 [Persicobacter psychrovividus]|uniref:Uncharacterized protein n=1 Tax=Persicobacter psychrovividus TaxID=387638 RepID=A0ABN6L5Q2_9BACT|nr:hypothetical protein PEPS_07720 [Persicobacter psychrovividus]